MKKDYNSDPLERFEKLFSEAKKKEPGLAEAMTLSTANKDGVPSARMVLLKKADDKGFVFYTNLESQKAKEIISNPIASLVFHWKSLKRQVCILGDVEKVSDEEADQYFSTRKRAAQIGSWASLQSQKMENRSDLENGVTKFTADFEGSKIIRPPFWSGFRVIPKKMEFWEERPFRLHQRDVYKRTSKGWDFFYLFP